MCSLSNMLLDTGVFIQNEYFLKYISLIEDNKFREPEKFKTQRHHIIPKCFYKDMSIPVNNDNSNLVNLLFKDHILAHCYIVLASKETQFKYKNMMALYKLMHHRDFKGIDYTSMEEYQMAYENSRKICYEYNPMFIEEYKMSHLKLMRSDAVRKRISDSMKNYRKEHPFSEEHRKKLSEAAMGNHNFGSGDTRSIGCYCILEDGSRYDFHSYKEAGVWWFETLNPFNGNYSEPTFQRKIRDSINGKPISYSRGSQKILVNNIKWFKKER